MIRTKRKKKKAHVKPILFRLNTRSAQIVKQKKEEKKKLLWFSDINCDLKCDLFLLIKKSYKFAVLVCRAAHLYISMTTKTNIIILKHKTHITVVVSESG